jgi:hypothetical protein
MRLTFNSTIKRILLVCALFSGGALACDVEENGCLGCNDDELPVCLEQFVGQICGKSGNPANCDARRAYDDIERHVLTSTGSHMSRVHGMHRSARKYQRR